ncbi:hypothetical protein D3C85_1543670 [compost metagenome]
MHRVEQFSQHLAGGSYQLFFKADALIALQYRGTALTDAAIPLADHRRYMFDLIATLLTLP